MNGAVANPVLRHGMVKICGFREPVHAAAAAAAGADLLGFIFAPARRQVTAETAKACIVAAREAAGERSILATGVFVDASLEEIEGVARVAGLDLVQLSGAETPRFVELLTVPAIKALRPQSGASPNSVIAEIETYLSVPRTPVGFLLDTYSAAAAGGTGDLGDWNLAAAVGAVCPIMLAGGLDPRNVGAAIRQVRPLAVDVSTGVETGGIKDAALIEDFTREAKAAFCS